MDRLDAEHVADRVDRVDLRGDIIVELDLGEGLVGRFPADHEQRQALVDAPFDEAFLGRQVEDVEAVDPRREDHHRGFQHRLSRRIILDQLIERGLVNDLAGSRRQIAPDFERARLRLRHLPLADVAQHVLQAVQEALALGLDRPLHHLRVSQSEIGWAHRVDEAFGGEAQFLAGRGIDPLDFVDAAEQPVGDRQIGLADRVEQRILAPFLGRESTILFLRRLRRRAEQLAPSFETLGPGVGSGGHQGHRVRASLAQLAEGGRPGGRLLRLEALGPGLHQHLLRAAHHQCPMLPILE